MGPVHNYYFQRLARDKTLIKPSEPGLPGTPNVVPHY